MGSGRVQGELWGRAPSDWADVQETFAGPLWEAMLDAVDVSLGSELLDAGCGAGGASVLASSRGAVVTGLDASAQLLDVARKRVPGGDFTVGDLEAMPFPDDHFDAVVAASSIQYTENPVTALRELSRVASPDALVAVALFSERDKVEYGVILDAVRGSLPDPPRGSGPFGLSEPGALEDLIAAAGMTPIASEEADCPFVYPDSDTFWRASISAGPVQSALEMVGASDLKKNVMDAAAPYRTQDGGFRFETSMRYVLARPAPHN